MHMLRLAFCLAAEADIRASCLESFKVTARRNFTVCVIAWDPDLDIIFLRSCESKISCAHAHNTVWQAKQLKYLFCVSSQLFQLIIRLFRLHKLYKLYFIELVLADQPSSVTAG